MIRIGLLKSIGAVFISTNPAAPRYYLKQLPILHCVETSGGHNTQSKYPRAVTAKASDQPIVFEKESVGGRNDTVFFEYRYPILAAGMQQQQQQQYFASTLRCAPSCPYNPARVFSTVPRWYLRI